MAAVIRKFNWADASDSDDDSTVVSSPVTNTNESAAKVMPAVTVAEPSTPTAQKMAAPQAASARSTTGANAGGLSDAEENCGDSPSMEAARELFPVDGNTPSRHCQEVTIQAAIPYKLKSVWNAPSPSVASACSAVVAPTLLHKVAAAGGNSPAMVGASPSTQQVSPAAGRSPLMLPSAAASSSAANGASPAAPTPMSLRPVRMNRALDELTSVLREHSGTLPYDELMHKAQWRSRFQPSFGSLFTFLKRNKDIFHYKQSIVELVQEATIVSELMKIDWASAAAKMAGAATSSAQK